MKTVSIHDAKTNLSKYIAAAKCGEVIYIGSYAKPEVRLSLASETDVSKAGKRQFGRVKTQFRAAEDAFSEQTDRQIANLMLKNDLEA